MVARWARSSSTNTDVVAVLFVHVDHEVARLGTARSLRDDVIRLTSSIQIQLEMNVVNNLTLDVRNNPPSTIVEVFCMPIGRY